jgi:hypothetical protein
MHQTNRFLLLHSHKISPKKLVFNDKNLLFWFIPGFLFCVTKPNLFIPGSLGPNFMANIHCYREIRTKQCLLQFATLCHAALCWDNKTWI